MTERDEVETMERIQAAQCLRNAHGHLAQALAYSTDPTLASPGRDQRAVRETIDATDWIRRAMEHFAVILAPNPHAENFHQAMERIEALPPSERSAVANRGVPRHLADAVDRIQAARHPTPTETPEPDSGR